MNKERKMKLKINSWGECLGLLLLVFAIWLALITFHLWLWNVIAVAIFGLPELTFWQFIGLNILVKGFISTVNTTNLMNRRDKEWEEL